MVVALFVYGNVRKYWMRNRKVKNNMSENTAQQISNSEGFWLEKIECSNSIAIDIDENLESEKTTYTFEDGSKIIFQAMVHGF